MVVNLITVAALVNWYIQTRVHATIPSSSASARAWSSLDAQGRCNDAVRIVHYANAWSLICQWRAPGQTIEGEAFPPPVGDPPWDNPRIVVYVALTQSPDQVARVIAHEMGHMYLTRTASDGPAWLKARGLAPDTPASRWVEDYAEVFAAAFGPDVHDWQGAGARPSQAEINRLAAEFFQGPPVSSR